MGVNIDKLQNKPMGDIIKQAESSLRKSYTVKVVAIKDGEIGVLSKRVEMKKPNLRRLDEKFYITTYLVAQNP